MPSNVLEKVFHGTVFHSKGISTFEQMDNGLIGVFSDGSIAFVKSDPSDNEIKAICDEFEFDRSQIHRLSHGQFIIPGFVDTHIHASQYPNAGTGLDLQLLDWLQTYTFPTEKLFGNSDFAKSAYAKVVARTLSSGTTTCSYYGTIHTQGTLILAETVKSLGQRAFVGKVNMDRNSPDDYIEETSASIRDTEQFINQVQELQCDRVTPIVTPRFAPTCSGHLMSSLATLANKYSVPIQTHISENYGEIEWVKQLHPESTNYTDVYDQFGLLTDRTIMAHGVYLSDSELKLFSERGVTLSHCPCSNYGLCSGICNVRKVLSHGVTVGLGTDVSGGYSPSMLQPFKEAIIASKSLHFNDSTVKPLSFEEVFYLATLGGAETMRLEKEIGNFVPGKKFDASIIDSLAMGSPIDIFEKDSKKDIFQKYLFNGDSRNVAAVFVSGKLVSGSFP